MKRLLLVFMAMVILASNMSVVGAKVEKESKTGEKVEFTDISNHWAKDVIIKMSSKALIKGVGNGKFCPMKR